MHGLTGLTRTDTGVTFTGNRCQFESKADTAIWGEGKHDCNRNR